MENLPVREGVSISDSNCTEIVAVREGIQLKKDVWSTLPSTQSLWILCIFQGIGDWNEGADALANSGISKLQLLILLFHGLFLLYSLPLL